MTTSTSCGKVPHCFFVLLGCLLFIGCGPSGLFLVVQLGDVRDNADSIQVLTTNNGIAAHQRPTLAVPIRPSFTFGMQLPDADPGRITVTVGAFDQVGCLLATGDGTIDVAAAGQNLALRITLAPLEPGSPPCVHSGPVLLSASPSRLYTSGYSPPDESCIARQHSPLRLLGWDLQPDSKVVIAGYPQPSAKVLSAHEIVLDTPILNSDPGGVPIRIESRELPTVERTDLLQVELAPVCMLESLPRSTAGTAMMLDTVAGDFNGDRRPDVAKLDSTGTVSFYDNPSDLAPGMQGLRAATQSFKLDQLPISAATHVRLLAGDLDGDGVADLQLVSSSGSATALNRKSGSGGYGSSWQVVAQKPGWLGRDGELVDLDGDGRLDLVRADAQLWLHKGTAAGLDDNPIPIAAVAVDAVAIGDFDRDGAPDLVTLHGSGEVQALYNQNGSFAMGPRYPARVGCPISPAGLAVGDLDGDGAPDVATNGTAAILLSRGRTFAFSYVSDAAACLSGTAVVAFDINRDGAGDLTWLLSGSALTVVLGTGRGKLAARNTRLLPEAVITQRIAIADFNQDGKPDLLVGTVVLLNNAP
jgi:hypothetical protein